MTSLIKDQTEGLIDLFGYTYVPDEEGGEPIVQYQFAEMAVIDHSPRSATVVAATDATIVPVGE
jgi:hypothetical protein